MNKKEFEKIFNECMGVKRNWAGDYYGGEWYVIEPSVTIRNFDVDMPNISDPDFNETFNIDDCDKTFNNFESAWKHYQSIERCRIIDATGQIWYDNYSGDTNE